MELFQVLNVPTVQTIRYNNIFNSELKSVTKQNKTVKFLTLITVKQHLSSIQVLQAAHTRPGGLKYFRVSYYEMAYFWKCTLGFYKGVFLVV